ncbi:MAG TPA: SH3 domain-containing protein, partial [Thermomicrobiales bacterium]|nr:SH3 domain-containing protein [Thermomicrobiales bacterium]
EAVIADAQGDPVRLREAPGYDGEIITLLPEGTTLDVLDGPFEADDGSFWYEVSRGEDSGYMVADYLARTDSDGGDTTTTSDLNLRAGPSTADEVLAVMPPGATVTFDGDPENGFYPVIYRGTSGWAYGGYLDLGDDGGSTPAIGEAVVTSDLNLRAGPSTGDDVLDVMPPGATVEILGDPENGFYPVRIDGAAGWAHGDYLDLGGDSEPRPAIGEAGVTTDLNLRAGPSTSDDVLAVMLPGDIVEILGDPESGFYPVRYGGEEGWAFADYLDFGGAADVGSAVIWPVSDGEWQISQGYNGSSHQNESSTWQYYYSFDIVRTDGDTAGQPVYSPVDGSVRWTERSSGGISIDMGNGYAAAIFHITVDPSLSWGDPLSQGQYIGYISGPGEDGNVGFDHLHFTLWATDDGGNWSREAVPFVGQNAIAGVEYWDTGGYSQWAGTVFYP